MNESAKHAYYVIAPRERPEFWQVTTFLWDGDANVDSDGNADNPASRTWTELEQHLRAKPQEEFSVMPAQVDPLILKVQSSDAHFAARVAYILARHMQSEVSKNLDGPYFKPETLVSEFGIDFDLNQAILRFQTSGSAKSTTAKPYPNSNN